MVEHRAFGKLLQQLALAIARGDSQASERLAARLVAKYPEREGAWLRGVLADPYFPVPMLAATLGANVEGMRFYIDKSRPDLEPGLLAEFKSWAQAFAAIRRDIELFFDPGTITCIPLDGRPHPLPKDQWCNLCGVCCQIGGVMVTSPPGVKYPPRWAVYLSGAAVINQQLCPFLWQVPGKQRFFCAIHRIKPLSCSSFGVDACRSRLQERPLHRALTAGAFSGGDKP